MALGVVVYRVALHHRVFGSIRVSLAEGCVGQRQADQKPPDRQAALAHRNPPVVIGSYPG